MKAKDTRRWQEKYFQDIADVWKNYWFRRLWLSFLPLVCIPYTTAVPLPQYSFTLPYVLNRVTTKTGNIPDVGIMFWQNTAHHISCLKIPIPFKIFFHEKKLCVKKLFFTPKGKKKLYVQIHPEKCPCRRTKLSMKPTRIHIFFPKPTFLLNFCASNLWRSSIISEIIYFFPPPCVVASTIMTFVLKKAM